MAVKLFAGDQMIKAALLAGVGTALLGLAAVSAPIASADAVGASCNDWMKISSDSSTGQRIFCAEATPGDHDSPLTWLSWDDPSARGWESLPLVASTGTPCSAPPFTFGRSTDSYVVWCEQGVWSVYSP
jgi:hypothetical protein